jgi:hypothetical protein
MDIIVTTPKSEMANAAREAADCIAAGGGEYFRRFHPRQAPTIGDGDRVYYVEDGFIRGFALVTQAEERAPMCCDTTGARWPAGFYIFMDAASWQWIRPIKVKGFRGFRYAGSALGTTAKRDAILMGDPALRWVDVLVVGGWLDPRPRSCRVCGCTDRFGCPPPRGPCSWIEPDLCSACR